MRTSPVSLIHSPSRSAVMAGAFTSPSGVTPLARNSSSKTSFSCTRTLRPPFVLIPARKNSYLSFSLLCKCNYTSTSASKPTRDPVISEGRDEDLNRPMCPGCGVFMQDSDPNLPGYYKRPSSKDKDDFADSHEVFEIDGEFDNGLLEEPDFDDDMEGFSDLEEFDSGSDWEDDSTLEKSKKGESSRKNVIEDKLAKSNSEDEAIELSDQTVSEKLEQYLNFDEGKQSEILESENDEKIRKKPERKKRLSSLGVNTFSNLDQFLEEESEDESFSDFDFDEIEEPSDLDEVGSDWDKDWDELDDEEKRKMELAGFAPPGVGYGNITEEYLKKIKKEKVTKSERKRKLREDAKSAKQEERGVTVCARCHSLRNYGKIKNPNAENLIPDFDFARFISTRLMKSTGTSLVVMVIDCTDFDGSFPKVAVKSLFKALEGARSKVSKLPKLVLVASKIDLLPSQISPARLDKWVRGRARANGAHKLDAVYQVSSRRDLNIRNLISCIKQLAGPRGNVWVVGAQNAGKSTLINAFAKKQGIKVTRLTEAAVPGTTLGLLRVTGILPAKVKMFDTPGLLHPGLVMNRLNREEQKMVEIRKELRPRSFRVKVGQAVHVGGLMRLDLIEASVQTIYITVWASPSISLHMGKIDNADELRKNHFGIRLQPPIGQDRVAELGDWTKREFKVRGTSWDISSVDIAVSGLGWFSLGLKGEATAALWTFSGVEVVQRDPLVLDRAPVLERPGFWLPQAISDLIGEENKRKAEARKRLEEQIEEDEELFLEASV